MRDLPSKNFPRLDSSDILFLGKAVSKEEIKTALFCTFPLKAPKIDVFRAFLFQTQWNLVRDVVCEWIQNVFNGQAINPYLDNTLIVHIPKSISPVSFAHFRLINLCTVLYKLVIKLIANHFRVVFPKIIAPEQVGFIAGRNITDNFFFAQEVIHSMRCKQKRRKWMAMKIDLEKAYDRVFPCKSYRVRSDRHPAYGIKL
ncbi:uncharacterized protein [Gossypium hirsutum]|uniref:Reverse transcriptase domain-containing protein n=1 Tax=Gossypium hirsutum TaxID=3635 RepID=A0A1U8MZC9_GOSHI|nr:uncharacterized protein LOC107942987 [Gossypium hirsutum]